MTAHREKSARFVVLALILSFAGTLSWAGELAGKITVQGLRSPENIAVYLDNIPEKTFSPSARHEVIDQIHSAFIPHVLIVLKGSTVDFKNEDDYGHNIYWPFVNGNRRLAHNMGTWPKGISKPFTFNDLGEVPIRCNVHKKMSGYIIVVPTPYFALTDKQGGFDVKNLPPGHYMLRAWSEDAKPATQAVTVGDGTTKVNITMHL